MNKEEVLKKARLRNKNDLDEREMQVYLKSYEYSVVVMMIICILLMLIKMSAQLPYYDVYSIFTGCMAMSAIYKGWKLNRKFDLGIGLCWTLITVVNLYVYFQDV